ncbi:MAG: glycosyltransferase family 4 protein [Ignisphaera sp.]
MTTTIAVISEKYCPEGGGAEIVTHSIVRWLLKRGYRVSIITGTPLNHEIKVELDERASSSRDSGYEYKHFKELRCTRKLYHWIFSPLLLSNNESFTRIIHESDIIYMPGILYSLLPFVRRKARAGAKIVIHLHNFQPITYSQFYIEVNSREQLLLADMKLLNNEFGRISLLISCLIPFITSTLSRILTNYADRIICPTESFKELIEKFVPSLRGKTAVAYNPLPLDEVKDIAPFQKERIIAYLGGDRFIKGYPLAKLVATKISNEIEDSRIYMVGFSRKPKYPISNNKIIFLERIKREEVFKLLERARVLLFPSIIAEPSPISILEAALLGAIPIAFATPTIQELLSGTDATSFLCPPYNMNCIHYKTKNILMMDPEEFAHISLRIRNQLLKKFGDNANLLVKLERAIVL